jgi:hypothetical protein
VAGLGDWFAFAGAGLVILIVALVGLLGMLLDTAPGGETGSGKTGSEERKGKTLRRRKASACKCRDTVALSVNIQPGRG